ncbi:MAG: site-specific integrase [Gammaproteobacteria bacterium]|nr:site-specific integrase [Gammaproteobacteria bacterium]
MTSPSDQTCKRNYRRHLKHLKLKGLQPKTIDAYSRAIRRIGAYFNNQITDLTEQQLTGYFSDLLENHSWSAVKLDLYGLKFYYQYVLRRFWQVHRNPVLLFPNRHGGLQVSHRATTPLDRGGVQTTLRQVVVECGIKEDLTPQSSTCLCYSPDRSRCRSA